MAACQQAINETHPFTEEAGDGSVQPSSSITGIRACSCEGALAHRCRRNAGRRAGERRRLGRQRCPECCAHRFRHPWVWLGQWRFHGQPAYTVHERQRWQSGSECSRDLVTTRRHACKSPRLLSQTQTT